MTVTEFLNQPYVLQRRITMKEQKAQYYRELASSISSPGFEEHYSASRNTEAPFLKFLMKADELEREIEDDYVKLSKLKEEIDHAIDVIEDENESMVLRYRYVMMMSLRDIARKMHYTTRWAQLTHVKAVTRLESFRTISQ